VTGAGLALLLIGLSAASCRGGRRSGGEPHFDDVPEPVPSLRLAAEVAADEALLGTMAISLPMTRPGELGRVRADVHAARELFRARGWLEKPAGYHRTPPPLESFELRPGGTIGTIAYEHLRLESGFEPWPEEPGREGLFAQGPNRTAHAWVVRQRDPSRPWLVCIHGYQMGIPRIDLRAFEAGASTTPASEPPLPRAAAPRAPQGRAPERRRL
jgi:hypothetical protein